MSMFCNSSCIVRLRVRAIREMGIGFGFEKGPARFSKGTSGDGKGPVPTPPVLAAAITTPPVLAGIGHSRFEIRPLSVRRPISGNGKEVCNEASFQASHASDWEDPCGCASDPQASIREAVRSAELMSYVPRRNRGGSSPQG